MSTLINFVTNQSASELRLYASTKRSVTAKPTSKSTVIRAAKQLSTVAPTIVFASTAPYMYASLVWDLETASTISAIAIGLSTGLQVLISLRANRFIELHGQFYAKHRDSFLTTIMLGWAISSMVVAAVVLSTGTAFLRDEVKKITELLVMAHWVSLIVGSLVHLTLNKSRQLVNSLYAPETNNETMAGSVGSPTAMLAAPLPVTATAADATFAMSVVSAIIAVLMGAGVYLASFVYVTTMGENQTGVQVVSSFISIFALFISAL